ncbi:MAG: hypothetical protein AMJ81_07420 [Phycisphaerae bacterium SM23_33]|nr:MAG: hypothetical protein AMJ81_07420 [Phycisphaerae bacterium SM23_33]
MPPPAAGRRSGKVLGSAAAEITWAALATTDQFIDDAFAPFADAPVTWPARSRRNAVLLLALFATAAAGTLFIRRPGARAAAAVILAAAATALAFPVPAWPPAVEAGEYHLQLHAQGEPVKLDSFAVLAARRTSRVRRKAHRLPHPVYPDREAAARDQAEVDPAERAIRLTVRRGQVRVVRPAGIGARFTELSGADLTAREAGGVTYVEGGFPLRPAFVVRDDNAWVLDASPGAEPTALRPEQSRSVWQVVSAPQQPGLRPEHVRLFHYWRQKYQRAGTLYALGFQRRASHFLLAVIEMKAAPATQPGSARPAQAGG